MHLFIQRFYSTRIPQTRVFWKYTLSGPLLTPGTPYVCSGLGSTGLSGRNDDDNDQGGDDDDDDETTSYSCDDVLKATQSGFWLSGDKTCALATSSCFGDIIPSLRGLTAYQGTRTHTM